MQLCCTRGRLSGRPVGRPNLFAGCQNGVGRRAPNGARSVLSFWWHRFATCVSPLSLVAQVCNLCVPWSLVAQVCNLCIPWFEMTVTWLRPPAAAHGLVAQVCNLCVPWSEMTVTWLRPPAAAHGTRVGVSGSPARTNSPGAVACGAKRPNHDPPRHALCPNPASSHHPQGLSTRRNPWAPAVRKVACPRFPLSVRPTAARVGRVRRGGL